MLKCYFYARGKAQWKKVVAAHLDTIRLSTADQPSRAPHLPVFVKRKTTKQRGAFANSVSTQVVNHSARVNRDMVDKSDRPNSVGSNDTSSIVVSSLHSSEMSDVSCSIFSNEQRSDAYHTQRCSSRECSMEEGSAHSSNDTNSNDNNSHDIDSIGSRSSEESERTDVTVQKDEEYSLSSSEDNDNSVESRSLSGQS